MKKLMYGIVLLAIVCCNQEKSRFSLYGKTNGVNDGIVLYMQDGLSKELIDSSTIVNNSFYFATKLSKYPEEVLLRSSDESFYTYLWVENNPMTFDASEKDFSKAVIHGSASQDLIYELYQKIDSLSFDESIKEQIKFIENNPNTVVSANVLFYSMKAMGKKEAERLFNTFPSHIKVSKYGKIIEEYIRLNKELKIGDQFVDFEMEGLDGEKKKLSDFNKKGVLLEFWASWCKPCRKENPHLLKTYEKYKAKGFEIFAVSLDKDKESWEKAIKEDGINWQHFSDLKGFDSPPTLIYDVQGIPDNFLINENGVIVGRGLSVDGLETMLDALFK